MNENQTKLDYRDPEWVAEQLGIDKNTVYKYLQDGALPGMRVLGRGVHLFGVPGGAGAQRALCWGDHDAFVVPGSVW